MGRKEKRSMGKKERILGEVVPRKRSRDWSYLSSLSE